MRDVAQKLLETMELALSKKKTGAGGNFQGILNMGRNIFDTTIKQASGKYHDLTPLIVRAQRLQVEGARVTGKVGKTAADAAPSRQVNMAAAFDFQKKRNRTSAPAVEEREPRPLVHQAPTSEVTAIDSEDALDLDLVRELLSLSGPKLIARMGSIEAVAVFAKELFGLERDPDLTDIQFINRVKTGLRALLTERNV